MKNKRIFCRSSLSDVFCKKGALKYLAKLTGKHVYRSLFFKKKFQDVGLQLYLEKAHALVFFCEIFKFLQNRFFIVYL